MAAEPYGLSGILLVDKPAGWTSHDVVAKVRRLTRQRRIGHTGTLDPMATGLLVLCLGSATRLAEYMTLHDKQYSGEITLGVTTDTDDAEGVETARRQVPAISDGRLRDLERQFTGELLQTPPLYSAVKVAGQRAYAVARKGGQVELRGRPVRVHALALSPGPFPDLAGEEGSRAVHEALRVEVACGPGTYVRSLARDIGEALGCGAHLSGLRRTRVAAFAVEEAWALADVEALAASGRLEEPLLPPDEGLLEWDAALLDAQHTAQFGHGLVTQLLARESARQGPLRVYNANGEFLGVGAMVGGKLLKPVKVMTSQ